MEYFPIFLDLQDRRCLVIGGGVVGERKAEALLQAGAEVTIISPQLTDRLSVWAEEHKIVHIGRKYRSGDLVGFALIFVATDDSTISEVVQKEGRARGIWVNAADDPTHCDFILPSILRRGELVIAVATGGLSPALSRSIREELEQYLTEDYGVLLQIVAEVRETLKRSSRRPSGEVWGKALDGEFRRLVERGEVEKAKSVLLERLGR